MITAEQAKELLAAADNPDEWWKCSLGDFVDLAQAVIDLAEQLQRAEARIADLERELREAENEAQYEGGW